MAGILDAMKGLFRGEEGLPEQARKESTDHTRGRSRKRTNQKAVRQATAKRRKRGKVKKKRKARKRRKTRSSGR